MKPSQQFPGVPVDENAEYRAKVLPTVQAGEGMKAFRSDIARLQIWQRIARMENRGGVMVTTDPGVCIQFDNGLYVADAVNVVNGNPGSPNETTAAFLDRMVQLRAVQGTDTHVFAYEEMAPAGEESSEFRMTDVLMRASLEELRGLFTPPEIEKMKLAKASRNDLIVAVMTLRKDVPSEWAIRAAGVAEVKPIE